MKPGSLNSRLLPERLFQILRLMYRVFRKMEEWAMELLFFRLSNSRIKFYCWQNGNFEKERLYF